MQVLYVSRVHLNPYVHLLASGVQQADDAIRTLQCPTLRWRRVLLDPRWRILHLHWIESQYAYGPPPHPHALHDLDRLLKQLTLVQKTGRKIVYTVHNLQDHEGRHPQLNRRANQWIFTHADAVHVHNRFSAGQVKQLFGREQDVFIIPHGNYIGYYPDEISRTEARDRLGIRDDRFVFLFLGQMRPYKGLDALILAFLKNADPRAILVLAGKVDDKDYETHLKQLAGDHPNIRIFSHFVPAEEVQVFFRASDIAVLPYRDVTTSGAALLAFSFGKPIIAPAIDPFPELLGGENNHGLLFHPVEDDLADVLNRAMSCDLVDMSRSALAFARTRDWARIGGQHARIYRRLLST